MNDQLPELNGFKLGLLMPDAGRVSTIPKLDTAPGFRVWSNQEITDFIKKKEPKLRRKQFAGKQFIFNQGSVGSCCLAATVGGFVRAAVLNGVAPADIPRLNHEFLYAQVNRNQDNGAILAEANEAIRTIGVPPMKSGHRYNKDIYKNSYGPDDYREAKNFVADGVYEAGTQQELATVLLSGQGAGVVAVHVGNNFMQVDRNGYPAASPRGQGNHAVGAQDVEIIDGKLAFDSFNSWGAEFADEGYMYLDWEDHLETTTSYHKFFVIISTAIKLNDDKAPNIAE